MPVSTPSGDVPISALEVGDLVLAYHEATGTTGTYTVTATWQHLDPFITTLTIAGEEIETTPEHPFFVLLRGWVLAGDLRVGDSVRLRDGSYALVEATETAYDPQVMYNVTVAGAHTYFVGEDGCTVHNCGNTRDIRVPDNEIVLIGSNNKPGNFLLREVDKLPIGDVTTPGKSASIAGADLTPENEIPLIFGRPANNHDILSGAFVEDIRAAGFDVVHAPTIQNPRHVRIIEAVRTFDEEGTEWLSIAVDRLGRTQCRK